MKCSRRPGQRARTGVGALRVDVVAMHGPTSFTISPSEERYRALEMASEASAKKATSECDSAMYLGGGEAERTRRLSTHS